MKFYLTMLATIICTLSYAKEIDYFKCTAVSGLGAGNYINSNGNLHLSKELQVVSKDTVGNVEKFKIKGTGDASQLIEVLIEKDKNGRVTKIATGPDTLSEKTIEKINKFQIENLVSSTVFGSNSAFGNKVTKSGFGSNATNYLEPKHPVEDNIGNFHFKTLSELTWFERKSLGLTGKDFRYLKSKAKKDKKTVARIREGIKKIQEKSKPVYPLGLESEFEIKNGECIPVKVSQRMLHTDTNQVKLYETFSKDRCIQIASSLLIHNSVVTNCHEASLDIQKEMQKRNIPSSVNKNGTVDNFIGVSVFGSLIRQFEGCEEIFGQLISFERDKSKKSTVIKEDN